MFEIAEVGRAVSNKEFKKTAPLVRQQLLELQQRLFSQKDFRIILVFAGVDGAGKSDSVALLNQWMDARWLSTCAYDEPTNSEKERPEFWRYWRDLPPRGRIGMFLSAWYSQPVLDRVYGNIDDTTFIKHLDRIVAFETALVEEGALILKFWMHLSRQAQERRLSSLEKDPLAVARVSERDWAHWRIYDRFIEAAEQVVARTNTGKSSWTIVEGADTNYRSLKVTTILRDALRQNLDVKALSSAGSEPEWPNGKKPVKSKKAKRKNAGKAGVEKGDGLPGANITILNLLDMNRAADKSAYETELKELQARLHHLHLLAKEKGVSSILLFEGPDAAGKGSAIRRVTAALQPRNYQVHGIAAPTEDELAQHYLWRFWRNLSRAGRITIFDRSWYGRVLVERVEGLAVEAEWRRAYSEINDFESQLCEHGIVLLKYWIHITKDEQLARFKEREKTAYKSWKLTDEDWRNRDKWHDYEAAVHDMVQYTSTGEAPWILVEGNDKRYARLKVLRTFCDRLAESVGESVQEYLEDNAQ
jgi:polyphosphate:AMP phosphotransferase